MFWKIFGPKTDKSVFNEYLATITGSIIYFAVGIHTGWTSPFLIQLQSESYPFHISNDAASYIAIFGPIGDILGEIISTVIVDKIGRKNTLIFSGFPMLTSFILIYFSHFSPVLLYVARFLGGMCTGTVLSISTMYTSEISRPIIRGKLGVISAFSFILGSILVNLLGTYLNIQISSLIFAFIVVIFLTTFWLMPETPYNLLMRKRMKEAEESLRFFRRTPDVQKELLSLIEDVNRQSSERGNYVDLFLINSNKKALLIMVFSRIFQQLTGITAFTMYAQNLLSGSREWIAPQFALMVIYFFQALSVILCGNLSDKFGRVPLMVLTTASCFFTLILQGGYFTLRDFSNLNLPVSLPVILLGTYTVLFQLGIGCLHNVIMGEIFSTSIKPKAICVVNIMFSITVIFTTKFYQISNDYLHISVCFYTFAICSLIGALFYKFYLPETKGKTLEEIQMELKGILRRKSCISIS